MTKFKKFKNNVATEKMEIDKFNKEIKSIFIIIIILSVIGIILEFSILRILIYGTAIIVLSCYLKLKWNSDIFLKQLIE